MNIVPPEELGFASQRLARIKTKMQRYVDEQKLAGISSGNGGFSAAHVSGISCLRA